MSKRSERYRNEIKKTEKKIAELQAYLKGIRAALKQEEDLEMIRTIRGLKLDSNELAQFLGGIRDGSITFVNDNESSQMDSEEESFTEGEHDYYETR